MTKEISKQGQDDLVKTSTDGSIELSENDLQQVGGGQKIKTGGGQKSGDYLKVELENVLISS